MKLPGVLEGESQQRQGFLVFLYRLPGQYVELVGQTGRPAIQVQNVQEENQVQLAYRAPVVDPKIQRVKRPAATDVRFSDLLREPYGEVGRQDVLMRDEPLSGPSRSVSPACRDLPALVDFPAAAESGEMNAIEIPVVLASTVIVVDAILIPGIDEIGSKTLVECARKHDVDTAVAAFAIVADLAGYAAAFHEAAIDALRVCVHQQIQILADSKIESRADVSELLVLQAEVGRIESAGQISRRFVEHAGRR